MLQCHNQAVHRNQCAIRRLNLKLNITNALAAWVEAWYFIATQHFDETDVMLNKAEQTETRPQAVVIKKYANRRLYNTETSTYVTLEDLATMVRADRDFLVYDAKTGDDLTQAVLTQIIVEQEGRGGQTLLPVPFLRQLIRFYDDAIGKMVPSYLQFSLESLVQEQSRLREQFAPMFQQNPFGAAAFEALQQQTRKNMAIFEQAMSVWTPLSGSNMPVNPMAAAMAAANAFKAAAESAAGATASPGGADEAKAEAKSDGADELADLKAEFAKMQARIEKLSRSRN